METAAEPVVTINTVKSARPSLRNIFTLLINGALRHSIGLRSLALAMPHTRRAHSKLYFDNLNGVVMVPSDRVHFDEIAVMSFKITQPSLPAAAALAVRKQRRYKRRNLYPVISRTKHGD